MTHNSDLCTSTKKWNQNDNEDAHTSQWVDAH